MKSSKQVHPVYSQICDGCGRDWFASKDCWECPWCGLLAARPSWGGKGNTSPYDGGRGHRTRDEAKLFQEGETDVSEREILASMEENDDYDYDCYFI